MLKKYIYFSRYETVHPKRGSLKTHWPGCKSEEKNISTKRSTKSYVNITVLKHLQHEFFNETYQPADK